MVSGALYRRSTHWGGLAFAIALAFDSDHVGVVDDAIDEGRGAGGEGMGRAVERGYRPPSALGASCQNSMSLPSDPQNSVRVKSPMR
jgi:hypothetical protein